LQGTGDNKMTVAFGYTELAALACKLKKDDADALLGQAVTLVKDQPDAGDILAAMAEAMAQVSPELAEQVAALVPPDPHSTPSALARVIKEVSRYDARAARRLLATLPQTESVRRLQQRCGFIS
jgi:hypothetical protein